MVSTKYERARPGPLRMSLRPFAPGPLRTLLLRRERRSAAAARLGLGVDEGEAPLQPFGHVVERGAVEIEVALGVADHRHPVQLELLVVLAQLGIEFQRVGQARAAAAL